MDVAVKLVDYEDKEQAADLVNLLNSYALDPMGGGEALPAHVRENLVPSLARFSTAFSILAYAGNRAVGLVNCFVSLSTFNCREIVNIHDVVVLQAFRGNGISRQMLEAVERIARQRDCCKLTLEVLEGNSVAASAYLKFGFQAYQLDPAMGQAQFWHKVL